MITVFMVKQILKSVYGFTAEWMVEGMDTFDFHFAIFTNKRSNYCALAIKAVKTLHLILLTLKIEFRNAMHMTTIAIVTQ